MKVKEAMHKGTTCVEPSTSVIDVAKQMRDDDVGAIPVRADGRLVGIITDRDITCRAVPSRPRKFHPEPLTDPDLILSHHPARTID